MAQKTHVTLTVEASVGYITFFGTRHNALPGTTLSQLAKTITEAGNDSAIAVIVLKSEGASTFCAGANLNDMPAATSMATSKAFFSGFAHVINAMRKCPKIIIGRIQGKAIGGGVGLAAATDYCMATQAASIKLSELSIGIGPFVVEPAISRKIGPSAMSQITINAEVFFSAQWAKHKDLYAEVFPTIKALDEAVKALAEKLSHYHPDAIRQIKQVLWSGTDHWDTLLVARAETSAALALKPFTKKVLERFEAHTAK